METNAVNNEIVECIKSVVAKDMIDHLETAMGNICVNTSDFPEYNKTKLSVKEYLETLKFLSSKLIVILKSDYIKYRERGGGKT